MTSQFYVCFFVLAVLAAMDGVFCLECQQCCYTDDTTAGLAVPQMAGDSAIACSTDNTDCLFGAKKYEQDCGTGEFRCLATLRPSSTTNKQVFIRMCQKKTPDAGSPKCDGTVDVEIKAAAGQDAAVTADAGVAGLTHCCDEDNCIAKDALWTTPAPPTGCPKPNAATRTGYNFTFFMFVGLAAKFF